MARAYYGTKISEHMTRTPEGYLICHGVPIARTGWQQYVSSELGLTDISGIVDVYRSPDEVFSPATIASVEGKTITDEHPSEWLNPSNENAYHRGHGQNARRGEGSEDEFLKTDLICKDSVLISKIENGKREVSCGYDCEYVPIGDRKYEQRNIRMNHIAVVNEGRAGDRVAIRDSKPEIKKEKPMDLLKHIFGLGMKEYAKDAKPEEVAEALKEAGKEGSENCKGKDSDEDIKKELKEVKDSLAAFMSSTRDVLAQLVKSDKEVHEKMGTKDAIDAAIEEIEKEESEEKKETEDLDGYMAGGKFHPIRGSSNYSESTATGGQQSTNYYKHSGDDATTIEAIPSLSGEDLPRDPLPGADSKAFMVNTLRMFKPIIAAIPDEAARKKATDALITQFRDFLKPSKDGASYADLGRAKKPDAVASAEYRTQDSSTRDAVYEAQLKKHHRKPVGVAVDNNGGK